MSEFCLAQARFCMDLISAKPIDTHYDHQLALQGREWAAMAIAYEEQEQEAAIKAFENEFETTVVYKLAA